MKAAAAEGSSGAKDDTAKVTGLITYLRAHLRDVNSSSVTDAERSKWYSSLPKERNRTAAEIFKSGMGSSSELNIAFAAMASQAGLDARPAMVQDRAGAPFDPKVTTERYFLDNVDMAVRIGDAWKVFDVSQKLLPANMLSWREEGVYALITDPKTPVFERTPMSPPEASSAMRTAKLELSADGEIEGDVLETLTGHKAEEYRRRALDEAEAARIDKLKELLGELFPRADVSGVKILNVEDSSKPIEIHYHLRAPYAQVTGKRILFQPVVFHRSEASPFSASVRLHPVEFPYAWMESDSVTIKLPPSFELENADPPAGMNLGSTGSYVFRMALNKASNELAVTRQFTFGAKEQISYFAKDYPAVKRVFDEVHSRDRHTMAIRERQ